MNRAFIGLGIAVGAVALVAGCSSTSTESQQSSSPSASATATPSKAAGSSAPAVAKSGYISLADYENDPAAYAGSNVVLFFRADWCSGCEIADKNLNEAKGKFPADLVVVNVDYDDNTELRKEFGVTVQHTFVEIAPNGDMMKKWTGSLTAQDIDEQV